jgi:uncharacterized protein (TIGR00661 family)
VSGTQGQIELPFPVQYDKRGLSLFYSKRGGVSFIQTLLRNNFLRFFKDVFLFDVKKYDLIINDFEPITAWASFIFGGNCVSLSHQAALWFQESPKPENFNRSFFYLIKYFAPATRFYGFHFKSYHKRIFPPVIRQKIRKLQPTEGDRYLVYLPGYSIEILESFFKNTNAKWDVFSPRVHQNLKAGNCHFYPVNETHFLESLATCKGVLCGAGFELPSEALFLKKKLFVIPLKGQLEQHYNAKALEDLGVPVSYDLDFNMIDIWIKSSQDIQLNFNFDLDYNLRFILAENTGDLRMLVKETS